MTYSRKTYSGRPRFSIIILVAVLLGGTLLNTGRGRVLAQNAEQDRASALEELFASVQGAPSQEAPRVATTGAGFVRFLGAPSSGSFASGSNAADPEASAAAFLERWRGLFVAGGASLAFDAVLVKESGNRAYVSFEQSYAGVPVYAAKIIVQVNDAGGIDSVTSDVLVDASDFDSGKVATAPTLDAAAAQAIALEWIVGQFPGFTFAASEPELLVYDPLVVGEDGSAQLVWAMEAGATNSAAIKEFVLVDAHDGEIALHYSLIHEAKFRVIFDSNNSTADPGVLVRVEGGASIGLVDADQAYDYFGDTYDFYFNEHGRDSLDDAGFTLSGTVRYCDPFFPCPLENAFWDGSRMYFGEGFAVDDVVSHELTHGVTTSESNLIYLNESGAINESFSDMWGEWVDQGNGAGDDSAGVKWLLGEDIPGIGAIRDMSDPPVFGDPDRMGSPLWFTGTTDNGGVHTNSGVGNKLAYLLTDGDTFNGHTVVAMGVSTTADLFYECQVNLLTSGSEYGDLYNALTQAAINLGLSEADRDNVEEACLAVEIKVLSEAISDFTASTVDGDPNVELSWTNPTQPGLQAIIIRRGTIGFPPNPTAGAAVHFGLGTSTTDGPLTIGTTYYYSAWAFYGGSDFSAVAELEAVAGEQSPDYFTELFDSFDNDLSFKMLTLTPDASSNFYSACIQAADAYYTYTDPSGGTLLPLTDDSFAQVVLTGGSTVSLYGTSTNSFFVGSNGYITIDSGNTGYTESLSAHFGVPRISALFDDLDPGSGSASVSWKQLEDRVAITYGNVPQFGGTDSNTFQIEWFFDGVIRIIWLNIDAADGLAGISAGGGEPAGFIESDISGYPECGSAPYIEVTSPNGGESWEAGSTHDITWDSSGVSGLVRLFLLKSGAAVSILAPFVPVDSGTFSWTIDALETPDSDYRVQVVSLPDPSIADDSDADFAITGLVGSITVTSPNGGEAWAVGTSHPITWTSSGVVGVVRIFLLRNGNIVRVLAPAVPVGVGSYTWDIAPGSPPANNLRVRVLSVFDPSVFDDSDTNFITTP